MFHEAVYTNIVGLYTIQHAQDQVRKPFTGDLINPGEAGYVQAALAMRILWTAVGDVPCADQLLGRREGERNDAK